MKNNEENKKNTNKNSKLKETSTKKTPKKNNSSKATTPKRSNKVASVKKESLKKSTKPTSNARAVKTTSKKTTMPKTKSDTKNISKVENSKKKNVLKKAENIPVEKKETIETINVESIKEESFVSKEESKKVFAVMAVIAAAFCIFFMVSKLTSKDEYSDIFSKDLDVAEIQYKDILISKLFKQKEDEYYVLIKCSDDKNLSTYEGYIKNYENYYGEENIKKVYTAKLDNAFNKAYYKETDSYEKNNLSFSKTTFVKISSGSITEAYTGNDISTKIQELINEASTN